MPISVISKNFSEYYLDEKRREYFLKVKNKQMKTRFNEAEKESFILIEKEDHL